VIKHILAMAITEGHFIGQTGPINTFPAAAAQSEVVSRWLFLHVARLLAFLHPTEHGLHGRDPLADVKQAPASGVLHLGDSECTAQP